MTTIKPIADTLHNIHEAASELQTVLMSLFDALLDRERQGMHFPPWLWRWNEEAHSQVRTTADLAGVFERSLLFDLPQEEEDSPFDLPQDEGGSP